MSLVGVEVTAGSGEQRSHRLGLRNGNVVVKATVPHSDVDIDIAQPKPPISPLGHLIGDVSGKARTHRLADRFQEHRPSRRVLQQPRVGFRSGQTKETIGFHGEPAGSGGDDGTCALRIFPRKFDQLPPVIVEGSPRGGYLIKRYNAADQSDPSHPIRYRHRNGERVWAAR